MSKPICNSGTLQRKQSEAGFTLVELLIALAVGSILVLLMATNVPGAKHRARTSSMMASAEHMADAMGQLNRDYPPGVAAQGGWSRTSPRPDLLLGTGSDWNNRFQPVSPTPSYESMEVVKPAGCSETEHRGAGIGDVQQRDGYCGGTRAKPSWCTSSVAFVSYDACVPYLQQWPANPFPRTGRCERYVVVFRNTESNPGCAGAMTVSRPAAGEPTFRVIAWGLGAPPARSVIAIMRKTVRARDTAQVADDCGYAGRRRCPGA